MTYVLDTNVFITAQNCHYPFDVCPAFWDWLVVERKNNNVISIHAVKDELRDDDIKRWVKANPSFFDVNDDTYLKDIASWVNAEERFDDAHIAHFLKKADPRLISYAKVKGGVVVTHERPEPNSKKVKIPDVCKIFEVRCVSPFQMLADLKARFILDRTPYKPQLPSGALLQQPLPIDINPTP